MEIKRAGSQPSAKGPTDWFTGTVRIDPLFSAPAPARVAGASVTFEPGARTAWHTHPLGQTLIVTAGSGRVQREGGPVEEIHPGDVIWFPPGERHWHGASPTTAMSHIAIQESLDGKVVEWMELVSDEQYGDCANLPTRDFKAPLRQDVAAILHRGIVLEKHDRANNPLETSHEFTIDRDFLATNYGPQAMIHLALSSPDTDGGPDMALNIAL